MRSICTALALLLAYLVLVFVAFRIVDLVLWWHNGVSSTEIVDPILLSVRHLKQLLEIRGVSYTGYVEKQELAELVRDSANVLRGEVDELKEMCKGGSLESERERLSTLPNPSNFEGAAHFYEEVKDTKDSVWLVQVVPATSEPLLDDYTWRVVRTQVAPFAIRTGIFDCRLDRRLCKSKGWNEPLLLLSLPRGTKPKDSVIMRTCTLTRPQAIFEWLSEELSIRVKKVESYEDLEKNWLGSHNSSFNSSTGVKVLLLTHLLHPPLFLAASSIKFTGRVTFGIFSIKKEESQKIGKVPVYLIVTPEKTLVYGRRKMEHFNLKAMNAFLTAIQPEMNDVFLCSLLLVNMFAVLYSLQVSLESWWRTWVVSIWTIVICNLCLFALWLVFLGSLCRWPALSTIGEWCIKVVRRIALSEIGSLIRSDWVRLIRSPWLLVSSLLSFGILAAKWKRTNSNSENEDHPVEEEQQERHHEQQQQWWEMDSLFRVSMRPHESSSDTELEEGMELLIRRLAIPNLWLHPASDADYIKHLYVWKYKVSRSIVIKKDSPEAVRRLMDADTDDCDDETVTKLCRSDSDVRLSDSEPEDFIIRVNDCAICLDKYRPSALLCALPCGHNYHHKCIVTWLQSGNHHCPVCRWPAYRAKKYRKSSL